MSDTFVPTADLKHALALLCPYQDPAEDPDALRGGAVMTLMKALGLKTLVADPFDGMIDQHRQDEDAIGLAVAIDSAVEKAFGSIKTIEAPFDALPENWPEDWDSKPFAKVVWTGEAGDPSSGIPSWSGLCVAPDQSGTILGDFLGGRTVEAARARILQSLFISGLTAEELVLHERRQTPQFQQADYYARLALGDDLPEMPLGGEPVKLIDYVAACRKASADLIAGCDADVGQLMSEPWLERAKAAEARIDAGERYV